MIRHAHIALAVTLILIGIGMLSGCIYVPMFNRPLQGRNADKAVGRAGSGRPLQLGISTRSAVERELGKPARISDDGRLLLYRWSTQKGVWFCTVLPVPIDKFNSTTLRIGDDGLLDSYETVTATDFYDGLYHVKAAYPLPEDFLKPEQRARGTRGYAPYRTTKRGEKR